MQTRAQFRAAVARLTAFRAADPARRPAVSYRVPEPQLREPRVFERLGSAGSAPNGVATLTGALAALHAGKTSAVELTQEAYRAVAAWEAHVHAFEYLMPQEEALDRAVALDATPLAQRGPLHGVPLSIKDVIHVAGMPTTASSTTLHDFVPNVDAAAVARLRGAGGVLIGKTTTHEFAMGVTTPQSRNPWDLSRDPGGSSGGAAVSLATGMALGALGTDTRASIRVPAALCGTVGFKPTYGLVSTHGIVMMSSSIDHVAPMARTTQDTALLLNVLVGHDSHDPTSVVRPPVDYRAFVGVQVRGLRLGVPTVALRGAEPAVLVRFQAALHALEARGVEVVEVDEPTAEDFELANAAGLLVSRCEALPFQNSLLGRDGERSYRADVREQIAEANQVLAGAYLEAQRFRAELAERMARLLTEYDALAMPTSRVVAPPSERGDEYLLVLSENCIPWSFIGFPAASVPCGLAPGTGLPVGIELVGAPFDDGVVLALGSAVEAELGMPILPSAP
ncbi:MAG: aspartyl-tRNA(Asn)/glutamyl-tRNA(Gln) amidotransferase subunit [Chloroflexota bacterium]|nr:aspartyl-tRNA(Asn)/glutamyl-tRNA(Gln) amidotransferase subunit [Chloroflexota bacterium]